MGQSDNLPVPLKYKDVSIRGDEVGCNAGEVLYYIYTPSPVTHYNYRAAVTISTTTDGKSTREATYIYPIK